MPQISEYVKGDLVTNPLLKSNPADPIVIIAREV